MVGPTTQISKTNTGHIMCSQYANLMKDDLYAQKKLNTNISVKEEVQS